MNAAVFLNMFIGVKDRSFVVLSQGISADVISFMFYFSREC